MLPQIEIARNYLLMMKMLTSWWGVHELVVEEKKCYLYELSSAMRYYSSSISEQTQFLTIAAQESKFSYTSIEAPLKNPNSGACGPYQIIPKWSVPEPKATCEDLHDPFEATWRAREALKAIGRMVSKENVMCYYATGNLECSHKKTPYSRKHEKIKRRIKKARREVLRYPEKYLGFVLQDLKRDCHVDHDTSAVPFRE